MEIIQRDQVTVLMGVPTMYAAILHGAGGTGDVSSLRLCVSGGAAMPVELMRGFEKHFGCMYPRHVWIVDALPHGGSGKILKRAITVPPLA